ncbi:hypothetical protein PHYPSEUDO_015320 [Phytophthora pseudosyringae]|uniref:M96 mating-specific protein family n=1 Tax=Phytophthora pseudosyringae TaxID=221518 RepID=A0A8T1W3V0_9STRA|nr:hypothetical protein PHYPSEUDO_015320 [Phytophthora pseudosyringae]
MEQQPPALSEMLEFFSDFLQEEHPEIVSSAAVDAKPTAASTSLPPLAVRSNQEESPNSDGHDSDDDGWEEGYMVGEAAEKESVDDGKISCTSLDMTSRPDKLPRDETPGTARGSNRYQKRQKEELKYLKGRVRELEDELRRVDDESHAKLGNSMWQRVAQQQSVARQQALSENARLREDLNEQIKFSKSLEKMIRKRSIFHAVEDPASQPRRRRKLMANTFNEELHACVAKESLRVDRVLASTGAAAFTTDCHSVRVKSKRDLKSRNCDVLRIEMLVARRFPFPFKAVADVIWAFFSDASNLTKMGGMRREVEVSDESLLATTTFTFPVGERSAEIKATAAFKKTVEAEFVVINWVSDGECRAKRGTRNAFKVVEKGWTKIEALPGDASGCIMRTVSQLNPTVNCQTEEGAHSDQSRSPLTDPETRDDGVNTEEIGILSELILGAYAKASGHIYAEVQNVLRASPRAAFPQTQRNLTSDFGDAAESVVARNTTYGPSKQGGTLDDETKEGVELQLRALDSDRENDEGTDWDSDDLAGECESSVDTDDDDDGPAQPDLQFDPVLLFDQALLESAGGVEQPAAGNVPGELLNVMATEGWNPLTKRAP